MRTALVLTCLLVCPTGLHAAQAVVSWEFPLAAWPGTRFILRLVTLQAGRPTQAERTLDVLPLAQCAQYPNWVAGTETLCAVLCLDTGDYSMSLSATRGSERSASSNVLDLEVSSRTPCQGGPNVTPLPPVVAKPSPPKPSPAYVAPAVAAALLAVGQSATPPALAALPNLGCVSWKILGPCFCGPTTPCLTVEYMEPAFVVEVVKKPGDTVIPILGTLLQGALNAAGLPAVGGGGAGNASGSGHTNLHYSEVHVYQIPNPLGGPCSGCAPSGRLGINYASELDSATWRTAVAVPSPLDLLLQVGVWGRMYPRGGKVIHGSEPVAGALAAVRALDIMKMPVGLPPNVDAHVILQPGDGGTPAACMQLAYPKTTPCLTAGTPPLLWETGTLSITGKYVWIIWAQRRCCVSPAQSTCGITLPGLGGSGQNWCVLPQLPTP
jgi:hypothetical protein